MKKALLNHNLFKFFLGFILLLTLVSSGVNSSFSLSLTEPEPISETEKIIEDSVKKNSTEQPQAIAFKETTPVKTQNNLSRFVFAMLGVLLSSLIIFAALKLYKKTFLKKSFDSHSFPQSSLETPKDFKQAINLFLFKTDK